MAGKRTQKWTVVLTMVVLALGLMACGTAAPTQPDTTATPAPSTEGQATPEAAEPTTETTTESEPTTSEEITWDTSPNEVIAQYGIVGGFRVRPSATELPQWTLYGDGTVVFTGEGMPSTGFTTPVLVGKLTDEEIRTLLSGVAEDGFWELEERYNLLDITDVTTALLYISQSDKAQQVTVYPAGNENTPEAFVAVMNRLLATRSMAATEYVATDFTLIAEAMGDLGEMPAENQAMFTEWNVEGVTLADSLGDGQKVDAAQAEAIQAFIATNSNRADEDGAGYLIRLEGVSPRPLRPISL